MIIDPSYFDRYFLGRQLELIYSYSIIKEFSNGTDALDFLASQTPRARKNLPQLATVDATTLQESGVTLLEKLQHCVQEAPPPAPPLKIFVTGTEQQITAFQGESPHDYQDGFIIKPVEINPLKTIISSLTL